MVGEVVVVAVVVVGVVVVVVVVQASFYYLLSTFQTMHFPTRFRSCFLQDNIPSP